MKSALILALMLAMPAFAQPPPPGSDDAEAMKPHSVWINRQKSPAGLLCCSEADGRPAEVRELTPGHYQVFYDRAHWPAGTNTWIDVPDEAVLKQQSPMLEPIVWILFGRVRCVALAGRS